MANGWKLFLAPLALLAASCASLWPITGAVAGGTLGALGGPLTAGLGAGAGAAAGATLAQDGRIDDANDRADESEARLLGIFETMLAASSDEVKAATLDAAAAAARDAAASAAEVAAEEAATGLDKFSAWVVGILKLTAAGVGLVVALALVAWLFLRGRGKRNIVKTIQSEIKQFSNGGK